MEYRGLTLDTFQAEAIDALQRGSSVLVCSDADGRPVGTITFSKSVQYKKHKGVAAWQRDRQNASHRRGFKTGLGWQTRDARLARRLCATVPGTCSSW